MDIKQFCINNLGKEFMTVFGYKSMIVGYHIDPINNSKFLITSSTRKTGWTTLDNNDTILLHSPLNITYGYERIEYVLI